MPRLTHFDYTHPGPYFVTICTHEKAPLFGAVVDYDMVRSPFGNIAHDEWLKTAELRPYVELDVFIIMPNHMHGILTIHPNTAVGAQRAAHLHNQNPTVHIPPRSLGAIIRSYKSAVTRSINQIRHTPGQKIWQRNYYEHIIRHEKSLDKIRTYVTANPARWHEDRFFA